MSDSFGVFTLGFCGRGLPRSCRARLGIASGVLVVTLGWTTSVLFAAQGDGAMVSQQWMKLATATQISVDQSDGKQPVKAKLHPAPLLSYTNPVRSRDQHGAIYLWTVADRPVALASFWSFRGSADTHRLSIEFHALCDQQMLEPILPQLVRPRRELPQWTPPTPSLVWKPLDDTVIASRSPALIRSITRRQANRFAAELKDPASGESKPLRLLPRPLHEYSQTTNQDGDVIYGAIFAYVLATDPEAFLHLEVRQTRTGPEMHFACTRMTGRPLAMTLNSNQVWSVDKAQVWDGNQAYYFCPNAADIGDL